VSKLLAFLKIFFSKPIDFLKINKLKKTIPLEKLVLLANLREEAIGSNLRHTFFCNTQHINAQTCYKK